jgi:hypothetical protein
LALLLPSFSYIIIMAIITCSYSIIVMLTHIACRHINICIALSIIHGCYQWCLLEYYYVVYQFISYCFCPGRRRPKIVDVVGPETEVDGHSSPQAKKLVLQESKAGLSY